MKGNIKYLNDRFKLWWNLTVFRFWVSIGKGQQAKKIMDRIPLPEQAADEAGFNGAERRLWGRYVDIEGNICPITWKSVFKTLLKVTAAVAIAVVLVRAGKELTGKISNLEYRLRNVTLTDLQKDSEKKLMLESGQALAVDVTRKPVYVGGEFLLPVILPLDKRDTIFYYPAQRFAETIESLPDCRAAIKFMLTGNRPIYYVYTPGTEAGGTWMGEEKMAVEKAQVLPGSGIWVLPQDKAARELHDQPSHDAPVTRVIPGEESVEFLRYAPISALAGKTLWLEVKYSIKNHENGQCARGWIAAFTLQQLYIKIKSGEAGENYLEVTANTLSFRESPESGAPKIAALNEISRGEQVEFREIAPITNLLTSDFMLIRVRCTASGENKVKEYEGWIAAGKIVKKSIAVTTETAPNE